MERLPNTREAALLNCLVKGEQDGHQLLERYSERARRRMPLGSFYVTLDRMEQRGLVRTRLENRASGRGGNRRKYFAITADGWRALQALRDAVGPEGWRAAAQGEPDGI